MKEFISMLIGGKFILERIDPDDVSRIRDITDRLDLAVDDSAIEG